MKGTIISKVIDRWFDVVRLDFLQIHSDYGQKHAFDELAENLTTRTSGSSMFWRHSISEKEI